MNPQRIGVLLNGVTGRMGYRQHLVRSILELRDDGGLELADGRRLAIEPVLVGRSAEKLRQIAERHDIERWTTDLEEGLADPTIDVYFDALATQARPAAVELAIAAGKHVYCEKPLAGSCEEALALARLANAAGVTNGVVHDKLYLPGLLKLKRLLDAGFFGQVLSLRGEFGYWVFEGDWQPAQRPSWNYRTEDGGGIVIDMFCHWSYVLEHLLGRVETVTAKAVTHVPERWDEQGRPYVATADDAAYGIFELAGGVIAQINSSWCVRVNRDELVEFQIDGTHGSAVAGLRNCRVQHRASTPMPVWNPDLPQPERFRDGWSEVPENATWDNAFKHQWREFLRDVVAGRPHEHDFLSSARGVQLADLGLASSEQGRRLDVPELAL